MTHILKVAFLRWLPFVAMATLVGMLVYGAVQQNFRSSANDPQIEMAEDTARALEGGVRPDAYNAKERVNIARSLAPFEIIYNDEREPVAASGELHGEIPKPPEGVFAFVKKYGEERVTWQPEPGVHIASVLRKYNGGFVLAGRSLREIEKREDRLTFNISVGWMAILAVTLVVSLFSVALEPRPQ